MKILSYCMCIYFYFFMFLKELWPSKEEREARLAHVGKRDIYSLEKDFTA